MCNIILNTCKMTIESCLVLLLALESSKLGKMITDEIVYTEATRVWKLDHARGGAVGWGQRKQPYGQRP